MVAGLFMLGLVAAGVGGGWYLGRTTGGEKPADYWLIGAFALGLLIGAAFSRK